MSIEDKILYILNKGKPLKAREIVELLANEFDLKIEKKEINRILYYNLKGKAIQDSDYRWRIISFEDINQEPRRPLEFVETPLSKLSSYYLECLSRDIEAGISEYASSRYGSPNYGQLTFLPNYCDEGIDIYSSEDVIKTINKVKRDRYRLVLQLGYPIILRKVIARTEFYVIEPLLLIPFDPETYLNNRVPKLLDEPPRFNFGAIKTLSGLDKNELFEEVVNLSNELGLNNPLNEMPELDDIVIRLQQIRPHWNWLAEMDPVSLTTSLLKEQTREGIYNAAAVFCSEKSKYTQGLEKELNDLRNLRTDDYSDSSIAQWISRKFPKYEYEEKILLEPLPLNEEQRHAVRKALQAPLTVITGPPGTGKSQIVTSIIINAVYQGQKVLFASKNHKAVDVVQERVNGLTSRPVMLRLGNNELQAHLAQYLTGLLSAKTSQTDKEQFAYYEKKHKELSKKVKTIEQCQEEIIKARNITDELERNIEQYRVFFGENTFRNFQMWDDAKIANIENMINRFFIDLVNADKKRQSFFTKIFWFIIHNTRFQKLNSTYKNMENMIKDFKVSVNSGLITEDNLDKYYVLHKKLQESLVKVKEIIDYFRALKFLQNQKSLFQLALEAKQLEEQIAENSYDLWETWLKILPSRLTPDYRKVLGDYTVLLNLIVKANETGSSVERKAFARYYELLPKVSNIISCWAVTSLSVRSRVPFVKGFFDLVVIDEASQCDIASALPLLFRAKRAVIIGDNKQLTHICAINERVDLQLLQKYDLEENYLNWSYAGNSLFGLAQSICSSDDLVILKDHHRSHADIINFSNKYFYDETLRIATKYEKLNVISNEPTIRWIDIVGKVESPSTGGSFNKNEANEVVKEIERLVRIGYKGSIGVVSPFRAQANLIRDLIYKDQELSEQLFLRDFLVDTVHRFQGDERDIIIFSPVISLNLGQGSRHFLSRTGNLFNVAITRARAALIVVGDRNTCSRCGIEYMEWFVDYLSKVKETRQTEFDYNIDLGPEYPSVSSQIQVSDWEKILYRALYRDGIRTIPQYQVEQYSLDLALFCEARKLDIEVDGEMYHRDWDGELCIRDQLRNKRLIELGWDVQRFWVYEIRDDLSGCIDRVRRWMADKN
jgi:very-short-patch-repair endonuclease